MAAGPESCYEDVSRKNLGEDGEEHRCTAPNAKEGYRFSKAMTNPGFIKRRRYQKYLFADGIYKFLRSKAGDLEVR